MMVTLPAKCDTTDSNSIASVRGVAHFKPTTFGISESLSAIASEMPELVQKVL